MAWKYVIVKVGNTEVPVIFPSRMVHALVVDHIKDYFVGEAKMVTPFLAKASLRQLRDQLVAVSAGECEIIVRSASGSSETLGIASRPDDKNRINMHPYTGGFL